MMSIHQFICIAKVFTRQCKYFAEQCLEEIKNRYVDELSDLVDCTAHLNMSLNKRVSFIWHETFIIKIIE